MRANSPSWAGTSLILDVGLANERQGHIAKRSRGLDGEAVGRAHINPLFDTREYGIEFTDGSMDKCTANVIAENMFAQVNYEGNQYLLINEIRIIERTIQIFPYLMV